MLLWICTSFCVGRFSFLLNRNQGVKFWGHMFNSEKYKWWYHFIIPLAMYECSNFSVSSLRLVIFCLKITIIIISILLGVKWSLIFKSEYFRWCNGKESACQCRRCKRHSFNLWIGKLPSKRKYILQYSCLENSKDRGAWQATVHGVAKSQAMLSDWAHTQHTLMQIQTRKQRRCSWA